MSMKKNFFKLLLLGAFTLSLGAGFVGCKDYDDDIKDLQGQIDDLKSGTVKSVTYDANTGILTVTPTTGTAQTYTIGTSLATYTLTSSVAADGKVTVTLNGGASPSSTTFEVAGGSDGFDPSKLTMNAAGKLLYNGEETGVTIPQQNGGAVVTITTNSDGEPIGYLIKQGALELPVTLGIADALPLKSLVFVPQAYLQGVEAMQATSILYNEWEEHIAMPNDSIGEIWEFLADTTTLSRPVVAYYHMNPASTTEAQIRSVSVISDDIRNLPLDALTRAAKSAPEVADYEVVAGGLLKVTFNFDSEEIFEIFGDSITSVAIQANVNYEGAQTTVTSDYAGVYRNLLLDFTLALNDKDEVGHGTFFGGNLIKRHVYGADSITVGLDGAPSATLQNPNGTYADSVKGYALVAIKNEADYTLAYDDREGLDLKEKIAIHYSEKLDFAYAELEGEKNLDMTKLADYGLGLRFSKSDYFQGANNTNQSDFINLTADGVVTAKVFGTEGPAAIDREPLIHVELVDLTNNNAVVNAGWIKVLIVRDAVVSPGIRDTLDFGELYVSCDDSLFVPTVEWMNVNIYNAMGMRRDDFHDIYTMVYTSAGAPNAQPMNLTDLGTVIEAADPTQTTTDLFTWTLDAAAQQAALDNVGGVASFTLAYAAPNRDSVFITLEAKFKEPTAEMGVKLDNYWNADKSKTYVNVEIPNTRTNYDDFHTDLDAIFDGAKINFTLPADAVAQSVYYSADSLQYWYQFDAAGVAAMNPQRDALGNSYTLTVDNSQVDTTVNVANGSYSYLVARKGTGTEVQVVAFIDSYTGFLEYYNGDSLATGYGATPSTNQSSNVTRIAFVPTTLNIVVPAGTTMTDNNSFGEALLNRDRALGSNMFGAPIEVILANPCDTILVTNGKFPAEFYRPVNVEGGSDRTFRDDTNNGDSIQYVNLVKLTDWRKYTGNDFWGADKSFATEAITGGYNSQSYTNYWDYYKVDSIYVDVALVTTTLKANGVAGSLGTDGTTAGGTLLSQRAPLVHLFDRSKAPNYAVAPGAMDYGDILYTNEGSPVQELFQLRLPVHVRYQWGEIVIYVDVTVNEVPPGGGE